MDQILQCNCRSLVSKKHELIYLINKFNLMIIAISETWLKPGFDFKMTGFNILRHDRADGWGGSALFTRKNCTFHSIPLPQFHNDNFNAVAARIGDIIHFLIHCS